MATTWYLRDTNAATGPTATASTDTDSFPTVPADKNTPKDMSPISGAAQTSVAGIYNTASTPLYTMARIFVGPALQAQILTGAQANYLVGLAIQESNAQMNLFDRCFVYVWRSGSGNVKTIIVPTSGGTEHGTSEVGTVITATGQAGNFSILAGDRIVVEAWWDIRNTKATNYTATYYYDGTTNVVDGTGTSDARGFFTCPQTLNAVFSQSVQESENVFDPTVSATKTAGGVPNTQTIQEFIKLFDVFSRPFASFQKQLQEYTTLFDPSIAKIAIIQKIFQEFAILADIYNSRTSVQKQFQEFTNLDDVYSSLKIFQRQIQEYINLGDILTYRTSIQQQIVDYMKLWDSISVTAGAPPITQTIQEYIKVFDSLTRSLVKIQVIYEWINIFESITTVSRYVRVSYEWMKSSDVISERLTSTRQIQEWIKLFDASTQTSSLIRIQTINEWLRIFESATMAARYVRISIEWVKLFETQTRLVGFNRQIVEYTIIFDAVTATTLSNLILQLIKCVELP